MTMFTIALLLAAGQAGPAAPDAEAMRAAAARCGLPADWLGFGQDEDGDYADPSTATWAARMKPDAILCITTWAGQTHARLGFLSEPPPGPQVLATLPTAAINDAVVAAEQCGLPIRIDPLDEGSALLLARRHAPPAPLACTRAWLTAQRLGPAPGR